MLQKSNTLKENVKNREESFWLKVHK